MKQKFNVITSTCIPLPLENVDTDQIIPARFLKAIDKEGMGDNLFRDWRYNADGTPKPDFVMNDPSYSGVILVAGKNFGSGSSREHAAWAIAGAGVVPAAGRGGRYPGCRLRAGGYPAAGRLDHCPDADSGRRR